MLRGSTVSVCEKVIASACEKAIASAHKKAIISVDPGGVGGIDERHREVQQSTFTWEIQKDLTYFCCMLVLKLFTLLFTVDTERINSLCMHEKVITSECGKVITSAHEKAIASACEKTIASVHEKAITSACEKVITSVDPGD